MRHAVASRPSAPASPSDRRRLPRAGRGAPRRGDAHRARRRRGRPLGRAPHRRRSGRARGGSWPRFAAGRRVRVVVTRAASQARAPRVARLEALGHEVVVCPADRDRAARRRAGRRQRLRLGDRHEPERRATCSRSDGKATVRASPRSAREPRRRSGASGSSPTSCRAVSTQEGLLAELPRPAGRVLFAGAEGARRLLVDELGADFVPLYRTRRARARAPGRRSRRARLGLGGARVRGARRAALPAVSIGPQTTRAARERRARRRRRGGDARPRRARRRRRGGIVSPLVITFLTDFGLAGRLRRHLPRRDEADRARGRDHRHHARDPAAGRAPGRARAREHRAVHAAGCAPRRRRSRRRRRRGAALALRDRDGRLYVGPDNGLLVPAAERLGGIAEAHELANPAYALDSISRTFHGRDLFAPAAAHLANGVPLTELGPPLDPDALVRLDLPVPVVGEARMRATILYVDRFGNVQLNLTREHLERGRHRAGHARRARARRASATTRSPRARSPTPGPGDIILYEDSYGNIAIAINGGSAAEMFGVRAPGRTSGSTGA